MTVVTRPGLSAPFRGLAPFGDSDLDALMFFGRDRETQVVVANLIASRLTVLYGPSGVGKSSLLRAGAARRLREIAGSRSVGVRPDAAVVVFSTWADEPRATLADAVAAEVAPLVPGAPAPAAGSSLVDVVDHWTAVLDGELYLILDQFEEHFVYHGEERGPGTLVDELPELVQRSARTHVLLSLRDDSLSQLDVFKKSIPHVLSNRLRLNRLDHRAAQAAVLGPIQQWNDLVEPDERFSIEPELVDDVLAQASVGAEDVAEIEPPYLQLVMERLWNEESALGAHVLRRSTLARLGGADAIVRDHLDRALAVLGEADQEAAARMFEHLVTPSGTKIAHRSSDLARFARVPPAAAAPVLGTLGRERILRPLDDVDGDRYEIFHDVLGAAILDWSRRREVEQERLGSRRRQRRLGALLAAALALVVVMTGVTAYALDQRHQARTQAALAVAAKNEAQRNRDKALSKERAARVAGKNLDRSLKKEKKTEAKLQKTNGELAESNDKLKEETARATQLADEKTELADEKTTLAAVADENANLAKASLRKLRLADKQIKRDLKNLADTNTELTKAKKKAQDLFASEKHTAETLLQTNNRLKAAYNAVTEAQASLKADELVYEALAQVNRYPEQTLDLALQANAQLATRRTAGRGLQANAPGGTRAQVERALRLGLLGVRGTRKFDGGDALVAAALDARGQRVLTAGRAGVRTFEARTHKLLLTLDTAPATAALLSPPDGSVAAAGFEDGRVVLWNAVTGKTLHTLKHDGAVTGLSMSPDGKLIVTASADKSFGIWDVTTGDAVKRVPVEGLVRAVTFSHDGSRILVIAAVTNAQRPARLYDTTGNLIQGFFQPNAQIRAAALSRDGTRLATGAYSGDVALFDTANARRLKTFTGHVSKITSVAYAPDGSRFATTSLDDTTRIWNVASLGLEFTLLGHAAAVTSAAYSLDGTHLVTTSTDRTARVWRAATGVLEAVLLGHADTVTAGSFSSDGASVLTAGEDGYARLWSSSLEPSLRVLGHDPGGAFGASFSADGKRLATAGADGRLRVWDPARRVVIASFNAGTKLTDAAISADGRYVAGAGSDGTARVWPVAGGRASLVRVGGAPLRSVAFSPDAGATQLVVTGGGDAAVTVWRWATGTRTLTIPRRSDLTGRCIEAAVVRGSCDAVFSPDGATIATGDVDGVVRLWRARDGVLVRPFAGHDPGDAAPFLGVTGVTFAPDGKRLVSSSRDKDARTWDIATGHPLRTYRGHSALVSGAGFSDDGRWVVTAGPSKAGIWDTTGTDLAADRLFFLSGNEKQMTSAVFAPRSQLVATTGLDGTVRTYDCWLCGGLDRLVPMARARLRALGMR